MNTLRISPNTLNGLDEVDRCLDAVEAIVD